MFSTSSLGFRLGSTIIIALLPLGALSVLQTKSTLEQVDATTLEGVSGTAQQAFRGQVELINDAQISARVLASVLSQSTPLGTSCVDRVKAVAKQIPTASLVAYIPLSGLMTCSSNGVVYDFKGDGRFQRLTAQPLPQLIYNPHGPVSGTAVIGVSHPVFNDTGTQIGIVAISLPYMSVAPDAYLDSVALWRPTYLVTFLSDGTMLSPSDPEISPDSVVPGGFDAKRLSLLANRPAFVKEADGDRHILSVVSLTHDLFLLSVWQRDSTAALGRFSYATPYLLPVLTWIAALTAAAFASSRLVVRHVRALSRSMSTYIATRQRLNLPDMNDAPCEIRNLLSAYEEMIQTIERDEAELQNLVFQKDQLVREVNHRSGNSLQLIASILRTYRRESSDPNLRQVLDGLFNRVIALSSTHTSLYAFSGQSDVAMDVVLANVIARLKEIHGVALGVATKSLPPLRLEAQAAIPLALSLAEAVGCFFSRPGLTKDAVTIALSEQDGFIHLRLQGPAVPELQPDATKGLVSLPQKMLRHFAAHLSGTINIAIDQDSATVDLIFPRRKLRDQK